MKKHFYHRLAISGALAITLAAPAALTLVAAGPVVHLVDADQISNNPIPDKTTDRQLTIHKYQLPKDFDTSKLMPGNGSIDDAKNLPVQAKPLAGAKFTVQKIEPVSGQKLDPNNSGSYTVDSTFAVQTMTTGADGTASLNFGPADGTYLVTEQETDATKGLKMAAPFFIAVPLTVHHVDKDGETDQGTQLNYDVHVYPKNYIDKGIPIDKTVNSGHHEDGKDGDDTEKVTTATVGHDVTWNLENGIAQNIAKAKDFVITDQLDPRLDFSGIKGFRLGYYDPADKVATLHDAAKLDLTAGTDYTVTPAPGQSGTVTITFTPAGRQKLADSVTFSTTKFDEGGNALAYAKADTKQEHPVVLVTDLGTKVNKHVLDKGKYGPIDNKFTVTTDGKTTPPSDNPHVPPIPDKPTPPDTPVIPKVPKAYFVNVGATKVSQEDAKALAGATFAIADTAENARAGRYIQVAPDGTYVYPGDDHYDDQDNRPLTQESNADGLVTFQGLKAKDAQQADDKQDVKADFSRPYYLVEIKAPAGYGLIKKPIEVTGDPVAAADPAAVKIEDPRHTPVTPDFPLTGSQGLLIVGVIIVTASGLAFVAKRKSDAAR